MYNVVMGRTKRKYGEVEIDKPKERDPEGGRHRSGAGPHDSRPKRERTRSRSNDNAIKESENDY